jgi:predicted transcriptional regulator
MLRWDQKQVAEAASVSLETIKRLEGMSGMVTATTSTVAAIKGALEAAGAIFIAENGEGPGVRLKKNPPQS